ncbi:TonB-dependent receptor [Alcaligenes sp. DN25]|uniref:TonB-dependent receptor domain-containing protein n=1 Tax=Alcaligenes TaxID=507 RepID=UPI000E7DD501|nr:MULTISPECIES: TonB-dependent receptor [Alcaligenes]ULH06317.1 TonB-dependent receptor [Alcaligenes faecalis]URW82295.1 TonB-dependent receptor [Alcaligenes sp. DN25]WEA67117.1 TonB-dependent receptor [Alcaligenes faecalis]HBJ68103.1 TonB-dependent receptor [Alcaligenes faecalis]
MTLLSIRPLMVALAGALPLIATAQTAPVAKLDQIVVTPSRMAQPLKNVVGDVTVIDQETLQKAGQSSVAEILQRQPGVEIYTEGGPQTVSGVYLRGTNPQHTRVMIDGMRINSSTSGSVNWQALDPALIERIEIVRGAGSSLYGADAIGGVINIITKKGGGDRALSAWGNVGIGSQDTFKASAGFSGASQGWDYSLASSYGTSDGFNATNPLAGIYTYNPDKNGYTQHGLSGSLGYEWAQGQHLGLTAINSYMDGQFDNGTFTSRTPSTQTRQQAYGLTSTNKLTELWTSRLSASLSKETVENRAYAARYSTLQRQYSWQNDLMFAQGHTVSLLAERLEERMTHTSVHNNDQRNTNAFALIYRGDINQHHLQASVRNDNISGYGHKVTGGLGYDLDVTNNWTVGLAANTGFRAPTFADLYTPYAAYTVGSFSGNPNLKPEKSRNVEGHIRYTDDTTELGLVVYQNRINDLINTYACDANFDCTTTNTEKARITGLTLTAMTQLGDTTLSASADFTNPKDRNTDKQLVRRAKQNYKVAVEQKFGALKTGAEYLFASHRFANSDNTERLGSYGLLNLTASYPLTSSLEAQLRWNNVLDKDYTLARLGYNNAGSSVFLNFAWRM